MKREHLADTDGQLARRVGVEKGGIDGQLDVLDRLACVDAMAVVVGGRRDAGVEALEEGRDGGGALAQGQLAREDHAKPLHRAAARLRRVARALAARFGLR